MKILEVIREWWAKNKTRPLSELLEVRFDEEKVEVVVLDELEEEWNQTFLWNDIRRICFKDEGIYASDILYIEVEGKENNHMVFTEAKGGDVFFGELEQRGLFPQPIFGKAIQSTDGGLYCWPEIEKDS